MTGADHGFTAVPQRRAFEGVVFQIEEAILASRLGLGGRLPSERELADIFAVSRASVREALRVLEGFGLVQVKRGVGPQSGLIVSVTDSGFANLLRLHASVLRIPLDDLLEIRVLVETWAAQLAAGRASDDSIEDLSSVVEEIRHAAEPEAFFEHDTEFHLTIARMSGNTIAPLIMAALREAIARQMLQAFRTLHDWPEERRLLIRDHAEIADLIASGQGDEVARAVEDHIRNFYARAFRKEGASTTRARPRGGLLIDEERAG